MAEHVVKILMMWKCFQAKPGVVEQSVVRIGVVLTTTAGAELRTVTVRLMMQHNSVTIPQIHAGHVFAARRGRAEDANVYGVSAKYITNLPRRCDSLQLIHLFATFTTCVFDFTLRPFPFGGFRRVSYELNPARGSLPPAVASVSMG